MTKYTHTATQRRAIEQLESELNTLVTFAVKNKKSVAKISLTAIQFELFCSFHAKNSDGYFYYENVKVQTRCKQ